MTDRWRSDDARRARTRQRKRTEPHRYVGAEVRYADTGETIRGPRCLHCGQVEDDPVHIRPDG